jgi:hypothetical protein
MSSLALIIFGLGFVARLAWLSLQGWLARLNDETSVPSSSRIFLLALIWPLTLLASTVHFLACQFLHRVDPDGQTDSMEFYGVIQPTSSTLTETYQARRWLRLVVDNSNTGALGQSSRPE